MAVDRDHLGACPPRRSPVAFDGEDCRYVNGPWSLAGAGAQPGGTQPCWQWRTGNSPRAVARRASWAIRPVPCGMHAPRAHARKGRAHACTQRRACAHARYRIRLGIARPGKEGEEWEKFDAAISALLERAYQELAQVVRLASLVDML